MSEANAWYELLIAGPGDTFERWLAAEDAAGGHGHWFPGSELPLEPGPWSERLRHLLSGRRHHLVFASGERVRGLVRSLAAEPELRLEWAKLVESASFELRVECYSRAAAAAIKGAFLSALPPGVSLAGFEQGEEEHPEAKGVELYAPAHDYVYRAGGRVVGPLPGVLEMHRRARELEFVHQEGIHLEAREVSLS